MFYIFYGEDEFRRSEEIAHFRREIVRDGMGDLNISVYDGRRVDLTELLDACSAVPFLTDRRLIIVEGLLQRLESRGRVSGDADGDAPAERAEGGEADRLCAYLPALPETTRLVFVEEGGLSRRNPVLRLAKTLGNKAYVKEFQLLSGKPLAAWVRQRARAKGVDVDAEALDVLISATGNDLRRVDQELEKLAGLVGYQGVISAQEVRALVAEDIQEDVFGLVDALGIRRPREAMRLLREALDAGANELYLLSMVARQIRLLLAARDMGDRGMSPADVQRKLRLHPFVALKLQPQVGRFTVQELQRIQRRVLKADHEIKTGRVEPSLALEMLVLDICRSRSGAAEHHQGRNRRRTRSAKVNSSSSPDPRSR